MPVPIESRHIEAILALAEELNFTRAATRLHLVQSTLSRQIEQAEDIVGFPICDRNSRQVVFTDAGNELANELRQARQHVNAGIHRGHIAHEGTEHVLLVGHSPYLDPDLMTLLLGIRLPQYPKLRVATAAEHAPELTQKLLDGALNVALLSRPVRTDTITFTHLSSEPLHAVMTEHHPAASKNVVSLTDFADDCWIVLQERANPAVYAALMNGAKAHGITMRDLHHILTLQEAIHLVSTGVGISVTTQGLARHLHEPGITCRPLSHSSLMLDTHIAIRRGDDSKLVNAFVRAYVRKHKELPTKEPTLFPL